MRQQTQRPTTAPRPNIDIKHIRQNPELYEQNCLERNYKIQSTYPSRINALFAQWQARQKDGRSLRERSNALRRQIANPATIQHEDEAEKGSTVTASGPLSDGPKKDVRTMTKDELLEEARLLKQALSAIEEDEARLSTEMTDLALAIPNLTSEDTPRGDELRVLTYINEPHPFESAPRSSDRVWHSHVHIGSELGIFDFAGAATTSGWGWYYLLDEGAQLEQALIAYALASVTRVTGWRQVAPPSIVYSHIAAACGFQPRDQNGETQVYTLSQSASDAARGKPELSLAGTAEIPLAGMRADSVVEASELPLKRVGVSRCYRAEAGARGADTKGLYRVHEFTKVEMFAWTPPTIEDTTDVFDEMVDMQTEILSSLGLHCRVLEMPSSDLGASAIRKIDIEAFFPSRAAQGLNDGWGEVTSASICTDYQTRRLATRMRGATTGVNRSAGGKLAYPWTVNGTALAVPRVLAALLENGWDESRMAVTIPECLRPWMDGKEKIEVKHRRS
ncbi:seryl-tRNA synthetase [Xylariaceae sp. AK1471]|nr:seryl-tRNA synthetase [Xylariaceae sp. AK1471]